MPLALAVISSVRVRPTAAAPLRAPLLALTRKELVMISGTRVVVGVGVGRTRRTRNDSILLCPVIQSAQPHDWKICASGSLTISVPLPINKFVAKRRVKVSANCSRPKYEILVEACVKVLTISVG